MKKSLSFWKKLSRCFLAFLILALAYLAVGLGTLGSTASTGKSYALNPKSAADSQQPAVVFRLDNPSDARLAVVQVYLNIGEIYAEPGEAAKLVLARGYDDSSSFNSYVEGYVENFRYDPADPEKPLATTGDALGNWIAPFTIPESGWQITSYHDYKLRCDTHGMLINEIVFVGEVLNGDERTGELRLIKDVKISEKPTVLPYNAENGETKEDALKAAAALIDEQRIPSMAQSSFYRYSTEEVYTLMSVRKMTMDGGYDDQNIGKYEGDRVNGALGTSLIALGTLMFGMSPFGLRFFPMLASFGTLIFGALLTRRLFKSDKACLGFTILYWLSSIAFGAGRLGTPLSIGVFFFVAALWCVHGFYANGMKKATLASALPLAFGGLFAACAILTNGVYVLPVAGLCVLFAFGMVRQQKARRYYLDKAIAEAEEGSVREPLPEAPVQKDAQPQEAQPAGKEKVAAVLSEYRFKNIAAPAVFALFLLVGALILSVLTVLPASNALVLLYDNPASPALGVFGLGWKAFAAGFTGGNAMVASSGWELFYPLFKGTGSMYAVTGIVVNAVAAACALAGVAYAIYRLVCIGKTGLKEKEARKELRSLLVPLAGLVLSVVTGLIAKGALAFVLLAYVFGFMLASYASHSIGEMGGKAAKILFGAEIGVLVLLVLSFLLASPFLFSVPLPAAFWARIL